MSVRDDIKTLSPTWLQDDSANGVGGKLMYGFGLAFDGLMEKLWQATSARMPKYADASALPYLGSDLLIPRGISQTDASYATHLGQAYDDWAVAGTPWGVLKQALSYVSPPGSPSPFGYVILPIYTYAPGTIGNSYIGAYYRNYYDTNTAAFGLQYNYPAADTTRPPTLDNTQLGGFDWDSLSQGTIGYESTLKQNFWRWFLILSKTFDQFGQYITSMTAGTPISVTTNAAHGLTTGDTVSIDGVSTQVGIIASITNSGGLFKITTTSPHGLSTGWQVAIVNELPNETSGRWFITVDSPTSFELNNSKFSTPSASASQGTVHLIFTDSSWTITVTGSTTFTLNGSVGSNYGPQSPLGVFGRVYKTAANNWVDKAPFVFGTPGVKIGQRPDASIGLNIPTKYVQALRNTMALWKAEQTNLEWIVLSFSPSLFSNTPGFGPDGRFGRWSKIVNNQYVPSRLSDARYISGVE